MKDFTTLICGKKKLTLISISLFLFIAFNLLEGDRGLISYYKNQNIKEQLIEQNKKLSLKLDLVERKNMLLTDKIDLDYLEILYREKFMVGKLNEHIYKIN